MIEIGLITGDPVWVAVACARRYLAAVMVEMLTLIRALKGDMVTRL
jgi:hypothetical protein